MNSGPEFYVGYLPMPAGLHRFVRRVAAGLAITVPVVAALLIAGQQPFAASVFEFGQYREYQGVLEALPYPALAVPGNGAPWLLVGEGKHGLGDLATINAWQGRMVHLEAARIYRRDGRMLEVLPGSLRPAAGGEGAAPMGDVDLGEVTLHGEIVDTKCYFGVMNPGSGKVHRDCAARCIAGGIPPGLLVRDAAGVARTVLLAGPAGQALHSELLDYVAEPVTIAGRLIRSGASLVLHADPRHIRREILP